MSAVYLYDDARARSFEPFALTRPAGELRAGALLVRERWARALAAPVALPAGSRGHGLPPAHTTTPAGPAASPGRPTRPVHAPDRLPMRASTGPPRWLRAPPGKT